MGKRDEYQAQIDALQAQMAELDDGEYDVWVREEGTGHEIKVGGKHGKSLLQRLGIVPADAAPDDDAAGAGADGGQDKPPVKRGYLK